MSRAWELAGGWGGHRRGGAGACRTPWAQVVPWLLAPPSAAPLAAPQPQCTHSVGGPEPHPPTPSPPPSSREYFPLLPSLPRSQAALGTATRGPRARVCTLPCAGQPPGSWAAGQLGAGPLSQGAPGSGAAVCRLPGVVTRGSCPPSVWAQPLVSAAIGAPGRAQWQRDGGGGAVSGVGAACTPVRHEVGEELARGAPTFPLTQASHLSPTRASRSDLFLGQTSKPVSQAVGSHGPRRAQAPAPFASTQEGSRWWVWVRPVARVPPAWPGKQEGQRVREAETSLRRDRLLPCPCCPPAWPRGKAASG